MTSPSEKLSESLEILHEIQNRGVVVFRSSELTRTHRERLCQNGFLQEVIKGWYIPSRPDEAAGESTAWYASFWKFCSSYLAHLKGKDWCLSPEQSVLLHVGNWTVPKQLLVRARKARNNMTTLLHGTSLFVVRSSLPDLNSIEEIEGIQVFSLPGALCRCTDEFFKKNPADSRAALAMISDSSAVLRILLEGGHSTVAGRLAGAFRNIQKDQIADDIVATMKAAGYDVRENDPYLKASPILFSQRDRSPYINRIRLMWQEMRDTVIACFPKSPSVSIDVNVHLKSIEEIYLTDAYHSLSIEGYQVTKELIERVRTGKWNPENNKDDRENRNALAARGYWQAYQAVRKSIEKVLSGENSGEVAENDHRTWYREMFAPGVVAGLLRPMDLAGYRNGPVYIRRSMHVPLNCEAVRDVMPEFYKLLEEEVEASVRVVLGHFIFVYVHPYMDGNGRMGRFLMNLMLAGGGYPWLVVPLEKRKVYMSALEEASIGRNIEPFTKLLAGLLEV